MNWRRNGNTWTLNKHDRPLAEVVLDENDGWYQWWRYTTIREHDIPPAGREPARRDAMKKAASGLVGSRSS